MKMETQIYAEDRFTREGKTTDYVISYKDIPGLGSTIHTGCPLNYVAAKAHGCSWAASESGQSLLEITTNQVPKMRIERGMVVIPRSLEQKELYQLADLLLHEMQRHEERFPPLFAKPELV